MCTLVYLFQWRDSMKVFVSVRFRQWTNMIRILILHFLLVSSSFNLIEHCHTKKMTFFDVHYQNLKQKRSNPNESKSLWIVDCQEKSWITKTKKQIAHKLLHQFSRTTPITLRFENEMELVKGYKSSIRKAETTRKPVTIKIVSPKNNDRFDSWGG